MPSKSTTGQNVISVDRIGKQYLLGQREPYKSLRSSITQLGKIRSQSAEKRREQFWALKNVSFEIAQGEAVGIIGHNGAGKSTLLKLLARVTAPTQGSATLHGRVSALLEVGTGFHPELTGRENIHLNGSILGLKQSQIREKFDRIVDFSEIGQFIDTPLKRYSSGMQVRLAFSVAAFLEPEILIVDEVLAVGDVAFQRKCLGQLNETTMEGRTVIFVSHNLAAIRSLCNRSIMLEHGAILLDGTTSEVIDTYLSSVSDASQDWNLTAAERPKVEMRHGMILRHASLLSPANASAIPVASPMAVRIDFEVALPSEDVVFVLDIFSLEDVWIGQTVSAASHPPFRFDEPGNYSIEIYLPTAPLQPQRYALGLSIRSGRGIEDWARRAGIIEFVEPEVVEYPSFSSTNGYLRLAASWKTPIRVDSDTKPTRE